MWYVKRTRVSMTLVVFSKKNTHAMYLFVVSKKSTHAMTLVVPCVVSEENTYFNDTSGSICGM